MLMPLTAYERWFGMRYVRNDQARLMLEGLGVDRAELERLLLCLGWLRGFPGVMEVVMKEDGEFGVWLGWKDTANKGIERAPVPRDKVYEDLLDRVDDKVARKLKIGIPAPGPDGEQLAGVPTEVVHDLIDRTESRAAERSRELMRQQEAEQERATQEALAGLREKLAAMEPTRGRVSSAEMFAAVQRKLEGLELGVKELRDILNLMRNTKE